MAILAPRRIRGMIAVCANEGKAAASGTRPEYVTGGGFAGG